MPRRVGISNPVRPSPPHPLPFPSFPSNPFLLCLPSLPQSTPFENQIIRTPTHPPFQTKPNRTKQKPPTPFDQTPVVKCNVHNTQYRARAPLPASAEDGMPRACKTPLFSHAPPHTAVQIPSQLSSAQLSSRHVNCFCHFTSSPVSASIISNRLSSLNSPSPFSSPPLSPTASPLNIGINPPTKPLTILSASTPTSPASAISTCVRPINSNIPETRRRISSILIFPPPPLGLPTLPSLPTSRCPPPLCALPSSRDAPPPSRLWLRAGESSSRVYWFLPTLPLRACGGRPPFLWLVVDNGVGFGGLGESGRDGSAGAGGSMAGCVVVDAVGLSGGECVAGAGARVSSPGSESEGWLRQIVAVRAERRKEEKSKEGRGKRYVPSTLRRSARPFRLFAASSRSFSRSSRISFSR